MAAIWSAYSLVVLAAPDRGRFRRAGRGVGRSIRPLSLWLRPARVMSPADGRSPSLREDQMEKDVVCGMQVDPAKAAGKTEHNGKTYYFCSPSCKRKFDANPSQYAR